MARFLVLGESPRDYENWITLLQRAGHEVKTTDGFERAVVLVAVESFDLIIVNQETTEELTLGFLKQLRGTSSDGRVLVVAASGTLEGAVEAMRLGAADYIRRPADPHASLGAVTRALTAVGSLSRAVEYPSYAAARWARAVAGLVYAPHDVRTLEEWGREVGASTGTLRNWCRAARLSPRRSLALGRLLRAARAARGGTWYPERLLDITDRRALEKLLALGGIPRTCSSISPAQVLANQQLILDASAIHALSAALRTTSVGSSGTNDSAF